MKKLLNSCAIVLVACSLLASCKSDPVAVAGVSISPASVTLKEKETATLTATVTPENAADQTVTWSSDNETVATVSNGTVVGVTAGTANIKVITTDGRKTATCAVTVIAPVVGIALDKQAVELYETEKVQLKVVFTPENASDKNIDWVSSDPGVATVSGGSITAVKAGNCTVTATSADGSKTATCSVTVLAHVAGLSFDVTEASINEGEKVTINPVITPDNATNKNITWSTSDPSVATVENGVVTGVNVGTATITGITEDGEKSATCTITVKAVVTGVQLDFDKLTIIKGQTGKLTATVLPLKASNKNVVWTSSDETVATVKDGVVTAIKAGTTTITVKTEDGGFTRTCAVTVSESSGFGNQDYDDKEWNW